MSCQPRAELKALHCSHNCSERSHSVVQPEAAQMGKEICREKATCPVAATGSLSRHGPGEPWAAAHS